MKGNDVIIEREIFDSIAGLLKPGGVRYIPTTARDEQELAAYLGFGAVGFRYRDDHNVFMVVVPTEHADWQSQRLASGLHPHRVYSTFGAAEVDVIEMCAR